MQGAVFFDFFDWADYQRAFQNRRVILFDRNTSRIPEAGGRGVFLLATKKLSEKGIKTLQPKEGRYSVPDGEGLRLYVYPEGSNRAKRWESRIPFRGKEIRISLRTWPGVPLDKARELHAQYRAEAEAGRDPRDLRKPAPKEEQTFEPLFWDWFEAKSPGWKEYHRYQTRNIGNLHVVPLFGRLVPANVRPIDVKRIITPLMQEKPTTGHKVLGICSRVFRYAVALGLVPSDPCRDLPRPLCPELGGINRPKNLLTVKWPSFQLLNWLTFHFPLTGRS